MDTRVLAQVQCFATVLGRGHLTPLALRVLGEHPAIPRNATSGLLKSKNLQGATWAGDHATGPLAGPDLERAHALNAQGWAVYATVNPLGGPDGPWSKKRFPMARAVVAEWDAKHGQTAPDWATLPVPPTMVIQSKGGPHAWWVLTQDVPAERAEAASQAVAAALGSDPTVWERTRILRVPGFWHHKDAQDPFWVHLTTHGSGTLVDLETLVAAYGTAPVQHATAALVDPTSASGIIQPLPTPEELTWAYGEAVRRLQAIGPSVQGQHGDDHLFRKVAPALHDLGLPWEHASRLLAWWNASCQPPWSEQELQDKWLRALDSREEPVGRDVELRRFQTLVDDLEAQKAQTAPGATRAPDPPTGHTAPPNAPWGGASASQDPTTAQPGTPAPPTQPAQSAVFQLQVQVAPDPTNPPAPAPGPGGSDPGTPPAPVPNTPPQWAIKPIVVQRLPNGAFALGFLRKVGMTTALATGLRSYGGALVQVTPDARLAGPLRSTDELSSFIGSACTPTEVTSEGAQRPLRGDERTTLARTLLLGVDPARYWPRIKSVTSIPQLLPNGTIRAHTGYDPLTETEFRFTHGEDLTPGPPESAASALEILLEAVADFPFQSAADRSVWVAALFTVFCRRAVQGPAPFFMFDANQSGAGKSLLARTIPTITDARTPRLHWGQDVEENKKVLVSTAMGGADVMLFDNISGRFGDVVMDQLLTSTEFHGRILGQSRMTEIHVGSMTMMGTGNNVIPRADVARRMLRCLLVNLNPPGQERPFRHQDLDGFLRRHRTIYTRAVLTLIQGWVNAGSPPPPSGWVAFPSYEAWSKVVRGLLAFYGLEDVFQAESNVAAIMGDEDGETEQQRAAILKAVETLLHKRGRADMSATEIMTALGEPDVAMDARIQPVMVYLKNPTHLPYLLRSHAQAHHKGLQLNFRRVHGERRWFTRRIYAEVHSLTPPATARA